MMRTFSGVAVMIFALAFCLPLSAATITGVVMTTDGDKPLTEAQIYGHGQPFDNVTVGKVNFYGPLRPDKKGAFVLDNVPPGRYTLFALALGHEMGRQGVNVTTEKGEYEISFSLSPVSSISGQIRDKNNQPVANAMMSFVASSLYRRIEGTTTTRADGSYTIYLATSYRQVIGNLTIEAFPGQESQITSMTGTPLPSNTINFSLSVKAPGYAFADLTNIPVTVGKDTPNVNFTLADKSTTLSGKVTSDDGRTPIPNANVQLSRLLSGGFSAGGRQPFTRTGADGAFTFPDVAPGTYQVYASAQDFTPMGNAHYAQVMVAAGKPAEGVHLMLTPAASIEGTVYENDGVTPLRNQMIDVRAQMMTEFGRTMRGATMNTPDGRYMMTHLEPGMYEVFVFVEQRGIAQVRTLSVSKGAKIKGFDMRLGAEPLLTLTVRSATDNKPVENAVVFMRTPDASSWWQVAKTDAQGILRIGGLQPQRYFFWATSPARGFNDYPRQNDEGTVVNVTADSGRYQAEIVLRGPASAVGRVVDEKKKPVSGAQLQMTPSSGGVVQSAVTDANGVFRVTPLRGDVYRLTVNKEGYESYADNVSVNDGVENKIQDVTLAFLGFGAIRGRVVSAQGTTRTSARGAQVSWRRQRGESGGMRINYSSWQGAPATTDENGVFQLENVPAGVYDVIVATVNGPVIVREMVLVKRNETTTLSEIVIPPTGTLTGKIRTPDGSPIPHSTEVIVGPPGMSGGLVPIMVRADARLPWMSDQYAGRVSEDGTFKVTGILPGKYEVIARGPGLLAPAPQLVEIKANQTASITFATPRSGKIVGRVSSLATSQPIAGAYVYLYDPVSNETLSSSTDAEGNYAIERVRPGVTRIVCRQRGYALAARFDVVVEAGETAIVDFLLTPGGTISGRVKGRLAQRAYNSSLQVAANGNLNMAAYVRADGSYRIENLPPGVYNVDLFLGNSGVLSVSGVVVEEGRETMGIDFELPPR